MDTGCSTVDGKFETRCTEIKLDLTFIFKCVRVTRGWI